MRNIKRFYFLKKLNDQKDKDKMKCRQMYQYLDQYDSNHIATSLCFENIYIYI